MDELIKDGPFDTIKVFGAFPILYFIDEGGHSEKCFVSDK